MISMQKTILESFIKTDLKQKKTLVMQLTYLKKQLNKKMIYYQNTIWLTFISMKMDFKMRNQYVLCF